MVQNLSLTSVIIPDLSVMATIAYLFNANSISFDVSRLAIGIVLCAMPEDCDEIEFASISKFCWYVTNYTFPVILLSMSSDF